MQLGDWPDLLEEARKSLLPSSEAGSSLVIANGTELWEEYLRINSQVDTNSIKTNILAAIANLAWLLKDVTNRTVLEEGFHTYLKRQKLW